VAAKKDRPKDDDRQGLMLRLPKELHTALRHLSIDRGVSLNAVITEVLEQWWAKQPERARYANAPRQGKRGSNVV
jgi:predicted HicB family RNase H-like nuclease